MNKTLFKYIFNIQASSMLFVSASVFFIVSLFDFAEITRKVPISSINETVFAIKLTFLKTPQTFHEILHYIYFVASTFSLWYLCRSQQITILKSVGRSPQQILLPFLSFALVIATLWLFFVQPLGLICADFQERITSPNKIHRENCDLWIDHHKNDLMIHIRSIKNGEISGISMFNTKTGERTFAKSAKIEYNSLKLKNVAVVRENRTENLEELSMVGCISSELINILSLPPQSRSIYSLFRIPDIEKQNQVKLKMYSLEMHKLLSKFVSFILFAIIAAIICFPITRYKTKTNIAIKIIISIIGFRFASGMLESLVHGSILPVELASWCVVSILLCLSVAILIWKEV